MATVSLCSKEVIINEKLSVTDAHDVGAKLYCTFNNVKKTADLVIYTLLLHIQNWQTRHKGKLPEVLYLQIDGGCENANQYLIAICELMVSKRMVREIHLNRLPRGHTHEDIDGVFGHVWTWMRNSIIETLEQFENGIVEAFRYGNLKANAEFLYVIPDYKEFLSNCIDPDFGKCFKLENTQHSWLFEAVLDSPAFPFGVKTMYRAYSSSKVIEFDKKTPSECITNIGMLTGLEARTVFVRWFPDKDTIPERRGIEGFYILKNLPSSENNWNGFKPVPFVEEGVKQFEKAYNSAIQLWITNPSVLQWWETWYSTYAPTGTAEDYLQTRLLRVPFKAYFTKPRSPILQTRFWIESLKVTTNRNQESK
jgi:hypothetical protein